MPASPDAYLVFIDYGETSGQIRIHQQRKGSPNRLTDSVLRRWVNLQTHDAGFVFRWKANYMGEVGVKSDKYPTLFNREVTDLLIRCSQQPNIRNSTGS